MVIHEFFRTYFALQLKAMVDSLQATGQVENLTSTMVILVVGFFIALAARLMGERLLAKTGVSPGSVVKQTNVRQRFGDRVFGWWYNRRK